MRARWGVAYLAAVGLLGEAGHRLFVRYGWAGHHLFHILYPVAAFALFAGWVIADSRAHGWPRFSWRLHPDPESVARNDSV